MQSYCCDDCVIIIEFVINVGKIVLTLFFSHIFRRLTCDTITIIVSPRKAIECYHSSCMDANRTSKLLALLLGAGGNVKKIFGKI